MSLNERDVLKIVRRLRRRDLQAWIQAGWVRPAKNTGGPDFDDADVARLRLICDLRMEMAVPNDVVPLVLSLLDQVHGLRRELRHVATAIEKQPKATRESILRTMSREMPERAPNMNAHEKGERR